MNGTMFAHTMNAPVLEVEVLQLVHVAAERLNCDLKVDT